MESLDFLTYTKWSLYATAFFFVLTLLAFILKWVFRFRLIGATGFMAVLTIGLFGLSLGLFSYKNIPGAIRYNLVYDNGANQAVIVVPSTINKEQLKATLEQAGNNLFSSGRTGVDKNETLTIRARVLLHNEPKMTKTLYVGQIQRVLSNLNSEQFKITIFEENFSQLPSEIIQKSS